MPTRAAFATRLVDRVDARGGAAADRQRAVGRREHHRVALHVLDDAPGEGERAPLGVVGLALRRDARRRQIFHRDVGLLHQQAAVDAPHVELVRRQALRMEAQQAPVLLLRQQRERVGVEARRDQHLGEDLVDGARQREIEGAARDDDAAEGRLGVGREGAPIGLLGGRAEPDTAGRVVLQDRDRRLPCRRTRGSARARPARRRGCCTRAPCRAAARRSRGSARRARRPGADSRRSGAVRSGRARPRDAAGSGPRPAPRARPARRGSRCRSARCARRPRARAGGASPRRGRPARAARARPRRSRRDRRRTPT